VRRAEALHHVSGLLVRAGCPAPLDDARQLLGDIVQEQPTDGPAGDLSPAAIDSLMSGVAKRVERQPLAHIRGRTVFRGLEMAVDPRVFVPRSETELLVEAARDLPAGASVLEPCTGSGAVAIALALERPDLDVTASDVSGDALDIARRNAVRYSAPVRFFRADGIASVPGGAFDAVVCNPPYVSETDRGTGVLPPELERHEPGQAFWAGIDGLALHERLIGELPDSVAWVAFEVGDGQDQKVEQLLGQRDLMVRDRHRTPGGSVRVVVAGR
jgi:release factor glutamine methyltransferase